MEGKIIVDGVLASCHASIDHDLGHIGRFPIRWFPKIMDWLFGEIKGFALYVAIVEEFGRWVLPYEQKYQTSNF